ncbi:MAG TPA: hypothetical protein DCY20_02200 [Firmicutes bacterium]|nr:hypothetical protein [Bacillota bacterium]
MDVLKDECLEQLGVLKDIDTLQILRQAQVVQAKREKLAIQLLIGLMFIVCTLAQVLLFMVIGFSSIVFVVGGAYVLLVCLMLVMLVAKGER